MGECNTHLSAYTLYRHLQQYCTHSSYHLLLPYYSLFFLTEQGPAYKGPGQHCPFPWSWKWPRSFGKDFILKTSRGKDNL